jgi:ankyrin repeat protein
LLDWEAKVNSVNNSNNTPLHYAAQIGYLPVVKLLVERGANVRVKNDKGETPSNKARSERKKDVAEWLDSLNLG